MDTTPDPTPILTPVVHIVGFSGGIDSQATALWVRNRFPKESIILLNADAGGNEHMLTREFIQSYSATVFPVTCVKAIVGDLAGSGKAKRERMGLADSDELTFPLLAEIKGRFPSRCAQFCTTFLKLEPSRRWQAENLPEGTEVVRYAGIRREEGKTSNSWRAHAPVEGWDDFFDCKIVRPIADWTKKMCFDYVRAHGEAINPLYSLGFDRVGCSPCVNAKKSDVLAWWQRDPTVIDKVREWERRVGATFFAPCVPRMKINWIDDVVEWSKTTRGGVEFNLLADLPRPACESNFGVCE